MVAVIVGGDDAKVSWPFAAECYGWWSCAVGRGGPERWLAEVTCCRHSPVSRVRLVEVGGQSAVIRQHLLLIGWQAFGGGHNFFLHLF